MVNGTLNAFYKGWNQHSPIRQAGLVKILEDLFQFLCKVSKYLPQPLDKSILSNMVTFSNVPIDVCSVFQFAQEGICRHSITPKSWFCFPILRSDTNAAVNLVCSTIKSFFFWNLIYKNIFIFFQRCSPPTLVLSLSPGLGPDGLPSPGGYFSHPAASGTSATASPTLSATAPTASFVCNSPPLLNGSPMSHRSSPCNEVLMAMRSNMNTGNWKMLKRNFRIPAFNSFILDSRLSSNHRLEHAFTQSSCCNGRNRCKGILFNCS